MDIDIRAAAKLANLAVPTIRRLIAQKQFPHYRSGRKLWFNTDDIIRWRESCHYLPTSENEVA
jgi:excisionase family DNA binding protein